MHPKQDLQHLYHRLGLTTDLGIPIVEEIRRGEPFRVPWSTAFTSSGAMASRKMGCSIGFESRTLEYAYLLELEWKEYVLEYYEQPYQLQIRTTRSDGRACAFKHVPDLLVIQPDSISFVELKPESKLVELAQKQPERFVETAEGWISPAANDALDGTGIVYRIVTDKDVNPITVRNIKYLRDFRSAA